MSSNYVRKNWHLSPDYRKRVGVFGEDLACSYLEKRGFKILERNVRFPIGEIDIVALDQNNICFIEVKTRQSLKYGRPSLAITNKKINTIRKLSEWYIKTHKIYAHLSPRIDVFEILLLEDGEKYVNHIKSAF